ncbi:MAG: TRAP transporter substrate-binding protein [Phaeodactylibacter sp.]|nr:TRAP transporter substrate-binding protein [Phaeodactylibacter sp.]MCB9266779.1 TRAP transporter substrate-binding protein [Lewinellaceae bacterium]MCB9287227.1 TRAP transporter substrate-binding protein [Lewinellaceae bacterium]
MHKKSSILLTFAVFCLLALAGCGKTTKTRTLKLAHGLDNTHPVHKGMEYMAERLAERSGGRLTIEIYPSQQLGTERQCLELLQIGSLAMTKVSAAVMENFAPNIQVLSLPYIFRDREHSFRVLDGEVGKKLLKQSEKYWLRGLTYFDAGYRSFYTKDRPIRKPEDLEGLKIRVQESVTAINLVRALGGAPTPISWGELYTALQQGVVDGAENNPPSFYLSHHYEVCKYYSLNEHTAVPDILIIGTIAWNSLSAQEQQWLQEAAQEATVYQRKLWAEAEQHALEEVQKAGVEVIHPDKKPFAEKTRGILDSYKNRPEMHQLIQEIQAVE